MLSGFAAQETEGAAASESKTEGQELKAALRRARWYASKLLTGGSSASALQIQLLMHVDTVLHSLDLGRMSYVFDRIIPSSLDSIETGAFSSTVSFLYQQSARSGVLQALANTTECNATRHTVPKVLCCAGQSTCSMVQTMLQVYGSSSSLLSLVRRSLADWDLQVQL